MARTLESGEYFESDVIHEWEAYVSFQGLLYLFIAIGVRVPFVVRVSSLRRMFGS